MKEQILEIINTVNSRRVSQTIAKDCKLYKWVIQNSQESTNFSQRIYDALYNENIVCKHGNSKKFKSITEGYSFCGRSNQCMCAQESVSKSVSKSKAKFSESKKQQINAKRVSTNLRKYGVINVGQTETAKTKHKQHYLKNKKHTQKPTLTLLEHSYNKLAHKLDQFGIDLLTPVTEYSGVSNQRYYDFACQNCGLEFQTYLDNGHIPVCKACNPTVPSYSSKAEQEVADFIKSISLSTHIIQNDKSIINPYELDIVLPELKIAVEYCGLYWHSSVQGKNIDYHYNKMKLANNKGYRLITIFEDEWIYKKDIVKSRLANILDKSTRYYARQLTIKQVATDVSRIFLESTHIQGYAGSSINFGLYNGDELLAIMTFGKSRYNKNYQYEIIRYSSKNTVVGGASKLFTHFIRTYEPESVISYCDMRWGTGAMYEKIGMTFIKQTAQGYSYTDFVKRYHRSTFTKSRLLKNTLASGETEQELAKSLGLYQIGDCGNSVYAWHKV